MFEKKTVWGVFRDYVNSQPIHSVISRQEIIEWLEKEELIAYNRHGRENSGNYSLNTLDSTRNMAEKVGYLGKTALSGFYEVLKHFPEDYTILQLRKDYDNR